MSAGLTGAVLAGGYSRRMGADKAALLWAGAPLWERQVRVLRQAGADPVGTVRRADQSALGAPCWRDLRQACGPLAGLETALAQCPTDSLLAVLAVDMPHLEAEWFRWLAGHCQPNRGAIPRHAEAFEPLAAIYPAAALETAAAHLDRHELSLQSLSAALVASGQAVAVEIPPERMSTVRSCNSQTDL